MCTHEMQSKEALQLYQKSSPDPAGSCRTRQCSPAGAAAAASGEDVEQQQQQHAWDGERCQTLFRAVVGMLVVGAAQLTISSLSCQPYKPWHQAAQHTTGTAGTRRHTKRQRTLTRVLRRWCAAGLASCHIALACQGDLHDTVAVTSTTAPTLIITISSVPCTCRTAPQAP